MFLTNSQQSDVRRILQKIAPKVNNNDNEIYVIFKAMEELYKKLEKIEKSIKDLESTGKDNANNIKDLQSKLSRR